jgi:hypothetical protein
MRTVMIAVLAASAEAFVVTSTAGRPSVATPRAAAPNALLVPPEALPTFSLLSEVLDADGERVSSGLWSHHLPSSPTARPSLISGRLITRVHVRPPRSPADVRRGRSSWVGLAPRSLCGRPHCTAACPSVAGRGGLQSAAERRGGGRERIRPQPPQEVSWSSDICTTCNGEWGFDLLSAFFLALATTRMDHIDVSNPRFAMSAVMPSCLTDTARNASRLSRIARGPRAQVLGRCCELRLARCRAEYLGISGLGPRSCT